MNKTMRFLSLLLLMALIPGAGFAQTPEGLSEADAVSQAEAVYTQLLNDESSAVYALLDDSVKAALTEEALAVGFAAEVGPLGAFQSFTAQQAAQRQDGMMVTLIAQHEGGPVQMTCVFTAAGTIGGIGLAGASAMQETADSLPLAPPEGAELRPVTLHAGTEMELTGELILPEGYTEATPFVVMAQGSGVSDLDETVGPNKPFRDIAYGLADRGIASIRYDKLHYAHPELASASTTVDDEYLGTVLEALRVARAEVDLGPAYLLGHSEGGMLTPYLMQQSEGGFSGGIILAGTPRQLWELIYDQTLAMVGGATEDQQQAVRAQLDSEKEKLHELMEMDEEELLGETVFNIPGAYIVHLNRIDPLAIAHENGAPLLILQGEEDFQVLADVDFIAWQEGLADLGDLVTYKLYPGLSHLFMTARGSIEDAVEAYSAPDLVDETVISDIADWISAQ